MDKNLMRFLPAISVLGALLALVSLIILSVQRKEIIEETGETYTSVERTLAQIQSSQPTSINDPIFHQAIAQAQGAPYIANLWIFSPDGEILQGNRAFSEGLVDDFTTDETKRVVAALSLDLLDDEQRTALAAASVMQAEGEHNDVYRHFLREVTDKDGELIAFVGATYDVSPSISASPSVLWVLLIVLSAMGLGMYWFSLPLWVFLDARARGEREWVWAVFVLIGNLVATFAYILSRVPQNQKVPAEE